MCDSWEIVGVFYLVQVGPDAVPVALVQLLNGRQHALAEHRPLQDRKGKTVSCPRKQRKHKAKAVSYQLLPEGRAVVCVDDRRARGGLALAVPVPDGNVIAEHGCRGKTARGS